MSDKPNRPVAGCLPLFFLLIMGACAPIQLRPYMDISADEAVQRSFHDDFIIVKTKASDTLSSLAAEYLNDPSGGWLIAEFNRVETVTPGQELVVPLKPFRRGGLKAGGYQTVPVLVYHRFSKKNPDAMTVTEAAFEEQMKFLKENGYRVITLDQLMDFLDFSGQIPEKSVLITLDDGWCSAYHIAFPILKKYNFPAALFVSTDFIGSRNALSWHQIRELAKNGFDIQCHTKTHRNLAKSDKTESFEEYFKNLNREISVPQKVIKEKLGKTCSYLAYPYGETNPLVIALLKKHGYRGALTLRRAGNPFYVHPFRMHRYVIYGNGDFMQFKRSLSVFRKWSGPLPGSAVSLQACRSHRGPEISLSEVCRARALENERTGELLLALLYWKAAYDLNPADPGISSKISALKAATEKKAMDHFKKGAAFYADDCFESARKEFLIALAYDPEHEEATDYLKNRLSEPDSIDYTVKEGDTFDRIASEIYRDSAKGFLIRYFTGISPGIKPKPETVLRLPVLDEKFSVKLLDQDIEKVSNSGATRHFSKAGSLGADERTASEGLEEESGTPVSCYSGNESCHGIKPQRTFGEGFSEMPAADGRNDSVRDENMDTRSELNVDRKQKAEEHYRAGIKFFINDELKKAIEEWEKTLSFNPAHQKAREDIKNAQDLLEKYKRHR